MNRLSKVFIRILPLLLFLCVVCTLFYKVIFFGQVFYESFDNFQYVVPLKQFLINQISSGVFPLWNPYLFTGIPYFADITIGTLSPFNIIFILLPAVYGVSIVSPLCIFLLLVFQYIFLRHLKFPSISAMIGSLAFGLAGNVFIHIGAMDVITVIAYIPLLFFCTVQFIQTKKVKYLLLLTLLQALQVVSGHPRITYYTGLWISFFILFASNFQWKKRVVITAVYGSGIVLLSAIQLIPFFEYVLFSSRPLSSLSYASSGSLSLPAIITFFFPTFFGTHKDGTWWGPQTILFGYLTVPGMIAFIVGFVRGKVAYKKFFVIGVIVSVLLAIGRLSPIFTLFYYFIPGWKSLRSPIDMLVFFTFFGSIVIASGAEYMIQNISQFKMVARKLFPTVLFASTFMSMAYVGIGRVPHFWHELLYVLKIIFPTFSLDRLLIYDSEKLQVMFQGMSANILFFVLSFLAVMALFLCFSQKKQVGISFLLLVAILFIAVDTNAVITAPYSSIYASQSVENVKEATTGDYRLLSLPIDLHQKREHLAISDFFYKESRAKISTYTGDTNMLEQIYQINGTGPLIPSSFAAFINPHNASLTQIDFADIPKNQLDLSSVRYIVSLENVESLSRSYRLINAIPGKRYIYENDSAKKRIYLLEEEGKGMVKVTANTAQRITVITSTPVANSLIFADLYYPGWYATVNGKNVLVHSYMGTFMRIDIPKGTSEVNLFYASVSFAIGEWVSDISLILFIGSYILFGKKHL